MNNEQVKKLNELSKEERNALYQPLPEYKGLQKCPWGIFVSISSILWSVLLIAFFAVWFTTEGTI